MHCTPDATAPPLQAQAAEQSAEASASSREDTVVQLRMQLAAARQQAEERSASVASLRKRLSTAEDAAARSEVGVVGSADPTVCLIVYGFDGGGGLLCTGAIKANTAHA